MLGPSGTFAQNLLAWYEQHRRDLPWRPPLGARTCVDPYAILVSELMLQQTQVATVIPYFQQFMSRFPTPAALAAANEQDVLRLWQGLGYYSRARHLQAAARKIIAEHSSAVPNTVDALRALPGVGRYTAGAVASIAFGIAAPILDGNVARVICRLDRIEKEPRDPATIQLLWRRAEEILPTDRAGDFNSALMELGATVCVPRSPCCLVCPVRQFCEAFAGGVQDRIPIPRSTRQTPLHLRWVLCIRSGDRWLIEQRPPRGRWAAMWQFATIEPMGRKPTRATIKRLFGMDASKPRELGEVRHALTHRRYLFSAYQAELRDSKTPLADPARKWVTREQIERYPLPRPHLRILEMLDESARASKKAPAIAPATSRQGQ